MCFSIKVLFRFN